MKGLLQFSVFLLLAVRATAAVEELKLNCKSASNPTSLTISMIRPTMQDDCDVNDDCNQTSGWFVLTADLANPQAPMGNEDNLDRNNDSFTEKEMGGLKIEQFEEFTIQLPASFRDDIDSIGSTTATVTSLVAEGDNPGEVSLTCTK